MPFGEKSSDHIHQSTEHAKQRCLISKNLATYQLDQEPHKFNISIYVQDLSMLFYDSPGNRGCRYNLSCLRETKLMSHSSYRGIQAVCSCLSSAGKVRTAVFAPWVFP